MVTDPIADMLVRIKNAGNAGLEFTIVPFSNLKFEIANLLLREGYIKSFSVKGKKVKKHLEVEIAYKAPRVPRIEDAQRVSKPSRRVYVGVSEMQPVKQGTGVAVISTPQGLLSGKEARKAKVGGELLFTMW